MIGVLLFLAALLCACSKKQANAPLDFGNTRYIVSLSKTYENSALLMGIDQNGEITQTIPYNGMGINSLVFFENKLFLFSSRENRHYILADTGEWQTFSYEDSDLEGIEDAASWFSIAGRNGLIEAMNIGFFGDHYRSAVQYTNNEERKTG